MYEDVIVTLLGLAVAFFLLIVLVLIVYMWSRINILEKRVGARAKNSEKSKSDKFGGDIMGYRGKEIWDLLQSTSEKERNIDQIRSRYASTLARHMEQVIDQGQLDQRKGRSVTPGNTATIGGVRGEVESWLPILEIDKLYHLGQRSAEDPGKVADHRQELYAIATILAGSLGLQKEAQGIARLVASHTIDFLQSINETEENGVDGGDHKIIDA